MEHLIKKYQKQILEADAELKKINGQIHGIDSSTINDMIPIEYYNLKIKQAIITTKIETTIAAIDDLLIY